MSFRIQMRFRKIIMEDGNRPVNNSLSLWKLLKELDDDLEEISDVKSPCCKTSCCTS
jgi:hypothetical protein